MPARGERVGHVFGVEAATGALRGVVVCDHVPVHADRVEVNDRRLVLVAVHDRVHERVVVGEPQRRVGGHPGDVAVGLLARPSAHICGHGLRGDRLRLLWVAAAEADAGLKVGENSLCESSLLDLPFVLPCKGGMQSRGAAGREDHLEQARPDEVRLVQVPVDRDSLVFWFQLLALKRGVQLSEQHEQNDCRLLLADLAHRALDDQDRVLGDDLVDADLHGVVEHARDRGLVEQPLELVAGCVHPDRNLAARVLQE